MDGTVLEIFYKGPPDGGAGRKIRVSPKSLGFITCGPNLLEILAEIEKFHRIGENFNLLVAADPIHPTVVKTFQ